MTSATHTLYNLCCSSMAPEDDSTLQGRGVVAKKKSRRQQIATTPLPCNVESSSGAIEEQHKL
ncbi:hypothetical protein KY289_028317 [Solanum tuberosum]|nr:hypothetical protein KY289_028317 [Solanum tuberosum]